MKNLFIALGFFFSFILGSVVTLAVMEEPIRIEQETQYGESEPLKVVAPSEVVISASKVESVSKMGKVLNEVTVLGTKGLKVSKVDDRLYLKPEKLYSNHMVQTINKTVIVDFIKDTYDWKYLSPITDFDRIEAKARSPGLATSSLVGINYLIYPVMLRSEKKALKNILRQLFANKHYFRIKDNGDIIIKERWYSQNKIRTNWNEVFNVILPRVMVSLSKDLAEDYFIKLTENKENLYNEFKLVKFVEKEFTNFCIETGFQGKTSIDDYELNFWKRNYIRIKIITREKLDNLKQRSIESFIGNATAPEKERVFIKRINALPSKTLVSLKQILDGQQTKFSHRSVGLCFSGIPNIDANWPRVFRLVEKEVFI